MHAREQFRNVIAGTALAGLASSTGAGVIYQSRAYPRTQFPAISVYGTAERSEVENETLNAPKIYRRFYDVAVEVAVQGGADPDGALDDLCEAIEIAMAGDSTLNGGGAIATDLVSTTYTISGEGDSEVHIARIVYSIEFRTAADGPDAVLL